MSEIIGDRLKKSVGKRCEIFLKNGFHYAGIINNSDDKWLELFEQKIQGYKLILIEDISDLEIKEEGK